MSSGSHNQNMESASSSKSPRRQLVFEVRDKDSGTDEDCENTMNMNVLKDINEIHSRIPDDMIPQKGLLFHTEEEAWQFYLKYAKQVGFGVRKQTRYNDSNGVLLDRTYVCCSEGRRRPDKRDANVKNPRPETRFNCKTTMRISRRKSDMFRITEFVKDHTHYLSSPCKTHMIRCHRKISPNQATDIDIANSVGIAPKVNRRKKAA